LSHSKPLSFISGSPIDLNEKLRQSNRAEFHHLMPKAFLQSTNQTEPNMNCLANFAFISRADNRSLGGDAPSQYRSKITGDLDEILKRSLCPQELFSDNYKTFLEKRTPLLSKTAEELCT
jgi:hypothetical protein